MVSQALKTYNSSIYYFLNSFKIQMNVLAYTYMTRFILFYPGVADASDLHFQPLLRDAKSAEVDEEW